MRPMRNLFITLFIYIAICINAYSQHRFVVINMETKVPVRNVIVRYAKDKQTCTIWDGSFILDSISDDIRSHNISLSKSGFMTMNLTATELTDTLELLPSMNALTEVIIHGYRRNKIHMSMKYTPSLYETLPSPADPALKVNADITGGIEKLLTYKRRKRYEEAKRRMEEY